MEAIVLAQNCVVSSVSLTAPPPPSSCDLDCGATCAMGEVCDPCTGACTPSCSAEMACSDSSLSCCGGLCTDTTMNLAACGGCGKTCGADADGCMNSACACGATAACGPQSLCCSGTCVPIDPQRCGCGLACDPNTTTGCTDNACVCKPGYALDPSDSTRCKQATIITDASARFFSGTGDSASILYFTITGTGSKPYFLRALGPSLASAGVSGTLADPTLTLFNTSMMLAFNDNWQSDPQKTAIAAAVTALGDPPMTMTEAGTIQTLPPGSYQVDIIGMSGTTGVALAGVTDLDPTNLSAHLTIVSGRANSEAADGTLIGGLKIVGPDMKKMVVRGLCGAELTTPPPAGEQLTMPKIRLFTNGSETDDNIGWKNDLKMSMIPVAQQPTMDASCAMFRMLGADPYTLIVEGATGGQTGITQFDFFDVD
jgi:hypothetical protein